MTHLPSIEIGPFIRAQGSIILPGSKSISNRALLLAALSSGTTTLKNLLDADDTQVMRNALRQLGLSVIDQPNHICVGLIGLFLCFGLQFHYVIGGHPIEVKSSFSLVY